MKEVFKNWDELQFACPGAAELIVRENATQCPDAKFLEGVLCSLDKLANEDEEQDEVELHVFFDVGTPNMVLWIWLHGSREELNDADEAYIDEYYEIPIDEAKAHCHLRSVK